MSTHMKATIISGIVSCIVMILCAVTLTAVGESAPANLAVVTSVTNVGPVDIVECEAIDHECWQFASNPNTWVIGETLTLTFTEDRVTDVQREGFTEDISVFFFLNQWR